MGSFPCSFNTSSCMGDIVNLGPGLKEVSKKKKPRTKQQLKMPLQHYYHTWKHAQVINIFDILIITWSYFDVVPAKSWGNIIGSSLCTQLTFYGVYVVFISKDCPLAFSRLQAYSFRTHFLKKHTIFHSPEVPNSA